MKLIEKVLREVSKTTSYFCEVCSEEHSVIWEIVKTRAEKNGKEFDYDSLECKCSVCHNKCFPSALADANIYLMQEAYRTQENIISLALIRDIPEKYNIKLRPLSKVLGLGEHTFTRYYEGEIPNAKNAELLKRIYDNPEEYREILCANSDQITEIAMKKSLQKVNSIIGDLNVDKVLRAVACRILDALSDVSSLALQKLLYYIQGFYAALFGENCYNTTCFAWEKGPVYPSVYYLKRTEDLWDESIQETELSVQLIEVIDAVIKYFGCYSGDTLKQFTHSESPWLRNRIEGNNNVEIPFDCLKAYFDSVINKFGIESVQDIKCYAMDRFQKL